MEDILLPSRRQTGNSRPPLDEAGTRKGHSHNWTQGAIFLYSIVSSLLLRIC